MSNPQIWDFIDVHFGTNGYPGTYVELSFESDSKSNIHVQDTAVKVCYNPGMNKIS